MINASTWQDQTEYQKMHNFSPDRDNAHSPSRDGRVDMRDFRK